MMTKLTDGRKLSPKRGVEEAESNPVMVQNSRKPQELEASGSFGHGCETKPSTRVENPLQKLLESTSTERNKHISVLGHLQIAELQQGPAWTSALHVPPAPTLLEPWGAEKTQE